jgi:hypothetical protein
MCRHLLILPSAALITAISLKSLDPPESGARPAAVRVDAGLFALLNRAHFTCD